MKRATVKILDLGNQNAKVILEGDLLIKNVKAFKTELASATTQFSTLTVALQNVTRIDIAFLQLLISLKNSYQSRLVIEFCKDEYLFNSLKTAGLSDIWQQ